MFVQLSDGAQLYLSHDRLAFWGILHIESCVCKAASKGCSACLEEVLLFVAG